MKTYKSVSSWLRSKPSEKELEKVLNLINKQSKSTIKKELKQKTLELEKIIKIQENLYKEIEEMKKVVGEVQPRKPRTPKNE